MLSARLPPHRTLPRPPFSHCSTSKRCIKLRAADATATVAEDTSRIWPVPQNAQQQTQQAIQAIEAAWRAGVTRQRVELLLPLIGATDLDDWPGGIRQQFKAAQPLVESIVRSTKQIPGLQDPISVEVWDQADAVGAWTSPSIAFVLFPTPGVIDRLRRVLEPASGSGPKLAVIVNPEWESRGNIMSEFGFGQRRVDSEAFAASFQQTYTNKQLRIYGDSLRVLRVYPDDFQVHQVDQRGASELLSTHPGPTAPTYAMLEALLKSRPGSSLNKTWWQRAKDEFKFNNDSLKNGPQ